MNNIMTTKMQQSIIKQRGTKNQRTATFLHSTPGFPVFPWHIMERLNNDYIRYTDFELFTAYYLYYYMDIDESEMIADMQQFMLEYWLCYCRNNSIITHLNDRCIDDEDKFVDALESEAVKRLVTNPDLGIGCVKVIKNAINVFIHWTPK